jgi:hypothetical protein
LDLDRSQKALRLYLIAAISLLLITTIIHAFLSWTNDAYLDHIPGVMIAMAYDLVHGVFYRPLIGPLGYGGTRYFPLHFVLQAAMMKLGGGPIATGYLITLGGFVLLFSGTYALLRRYGTSPWLAACAPILLLCSASAQDGLVRMRSDILPAALVVWGLAACAGPLPSSRWILVAAFLFTLAFSAKVTSVYGLGVAFLFLLLTGKRRRAWLLAALGASGMALVLLAMQIASHGRALEIMRACASAGAGTASILRAPMRFGVLATTVDVGGLPFLVLALAALLSWQRKFWKDIPPLFFICSGVTVVIIFGSPGTDINHFIDLQVAAIVLFTVWIQQAAGPALRFGLAALATAAVLAFFPVWNQIRRGQDTFPRRQEFSVALRYIANDPRPVLSENPLIPILAGRSPFVLDPFMFSVVRRNDPDFARELWIMLDRKQFGTVILLVNPQGEWGKTWYSQEHFGPGFAEEVLANYELVYSAQEEYIFKPRQP